VNSVSLERLDTAIRQSTFYYPNVSTFRAYAKINLGLHVLEKRPDGYHNIETVFHRINLFDTISFDSSPTIAITSSSTIVPRDERNICFKAASLLRELWGIHEGVRISIQKNIPVGAGLGGGSSDAATVLLHLPAFWRHTASDNLLHSLAIQLGSDVPYFLERGSALAKGRGESLEYFSFDVPYTILLCNPGIHVSTAWAYQHVKPARSSVDLKDLVVRGMENPSALSGLTNDFEETVFKEHQVIGQIKQTMLHSGAVCSLMSGSGSSVYGLFPSRKDVETCEGILRQRGYFVSMTAPHFQAP